MGERAFDEKQVRQDVQLAVCHGAGVYLMAPTGVPAEAGQQTVRRDWT